MQKLQNIVMEILLELLPCHLYAVVEIPRSILGALNHFRYILKFCALMEFNLSYICTFKLVEVLRIQSE